MTRTLIRNVSQQNQTLPLPYTGVLRGGEATVVADTPEAVIAYFGGSENVRSIWAVDIVSEGNPLGPYQRVTAAQNIADALAQLAVPLPVNGQRITNLGTPTAASDAATKSYVDSQAGSVVTLAQEYFVAGNGSDLGDGSLSAPWLTIGKAVTVANALTGDAFVRINVSPGTYSESFTISRRNVMVQGAGISAEEQYTRILGTVTVDSTTSTQAYNQQIALGGLFIWSSTASPAVRFTGTGTVMLVVNDSYLYATNAAANVLWCDSTAATQSIVVLRNCTVKHGSSSASASVVKADYGDIRFDSVRLSTTGAGSTGYGIELLNSSTLYADSAQIDVTTTAAAVFGSGTSTVTPIKVLITNSGVTNRGTNANSHAFSVTNGTLPTSIAVSAWQVILSAFTATAKVINGSVGQSGVYYGALTFGPNTLGVINKSIAAGVTLLPLTEKLGNLDTPLTSANGGTGLGAPAAGDVGKVLTATALGTYQLSAGGGAITALTGSVQPPTGAGPFAAGTPVGISTATGALVACDALLPATFPCIGIWTAASLIRIGGVEAVSGFAPGALLYVGEGGGLSATRPTTAGAVAQLVASGLVGGASIFVTTGGLQVII